MTHLRLDLQFLKLASVPARWSRSWEMYFSMMLRCLQHHMKFRNLSNLRSGDLHSVLVMTAEIGRKPMLWHIDTCRFVHSSSIFETTHFFRDKRRENTWQFPPAGQRNSFFIYRISHDFRKPILDLFWEPLTISDTLSRSIIHPYHICKLFLGRCVPGTKLSLSRFHCEPIVKSQLANRSNHASCPYAKTFTQSYQILTHSAFTESRQSTYSGISLHVF